MKFSNKRPLQLEKSTFFFELKILHIPFPPNYLVGRASSTYFPFPLV